MNRNEKEYFNLSIFNLHFCLRQHFIYFDKEKQKPVYRKAFKIYYEKDAGYDWIHKEWINFYTGCEKPCFVYDTFSYEDDNRHHMRMSLGWGLLYVYFPWKNHGTDWNDFNDPEPEYGYYFYGEGKFFDEIVLKLGKKSKTIYMPWALEFYKRSVLLKGNKWWGHTQKEIRKIKKQGKCVWNDPKFNIEYNDERIYTERVTFTYTTVGGEVQRTTATCHVEVREWRPRWFMWTKLFCHVRRDLEIEFDDEMGNERGSWKGGVMGVSAPITQEEIDKLDFVSPLRRYEKKVNEIHDYDR